MIWLAEILFVVVFSLFATTRQLAAQDSERQGLSEVPSSRLENEANRLVVRREYVEAVPLLQELASRLAQTGSPSLLEKLERVYFFLGVGLMHMEKLEQASETFAKYMEKFTKATDARYALQLEGDCLRQLERYDEAAVRYERLLAEYTLAIC